MSDIHRSRLCFTRLSERAVAPVRSSAKAAGYDLASAYDYVIPPGGKCLCKTDLQVAVPDGCYGRVAPRSGLASKFMIAAGAGVIDADYRGNVMVLLFNHGQEEFNVRAGDRVAQLILECIVTPDVEEVASLDETERGTGGFGSTGLRESRETNKEQQILENHDSPAKKLKSEAEVHGSNEELKPAC